MKWLLIPLLFLACTATDPDAGSAECELPVLDGQVCKTFDCLKSQLGSCEATVYLPDSCEGDYATLGQGSSGPDSCKLSYGSYENGEFTEKGSCEWLGNIANNDFIDISAENSAEDICGKV